MIATAINVKCPVCIKKLCKIKEIDGVRLLEVYHKGLYLLATNAIIGCTDCKRTFRVDAGSGLIEEVEIARG